MDYCCLCTFEIPVNRWSHVRLRFSLDPNTEIVGELDPVSFNEDSKEPKKRFGSPGPGKTTKLPSPFTSSKMTDEPGNVFHRRSCTPSRYCD